MSHDIVKYSNDFNDISFGKFGQTDFNLLMTLCAEMKELGTQKRTFTYKEIREKAGMQGSFSTKRTKEAVLAFREKMQTTVKIEKGDETIFLVLFPTLIVNHKKELVTVAVNEDALEYLNDLKNRFTIFELQEFVKLESKYAKTLFRLLKQFKTTGDLTISVEDFRRKLEIPQSYPNRNIEKQIIIPTVEALRGSFPDLDYDIIHASTRGNPIKSYRFSFTPDAPDRQLKIEDVNKDFALIKEQEKQKKKSGVKTTGSGHQGKRNTFTKIIKSDYGDMGDLESQIVDN